MPESKESVARFCKLCGRELEGAEKLSAVCVRCKSLGSAGTLDVQEAFSKALDQYHARRRSLLANCLGTWAFVLALVPVVCVGILTLVTGDMARSIGWAVTALAPLEILALCMALVGLLARGSDPTLSLLAVVINGAALAVFAHRLGGIVATLSELPGGATFRAVFAELFK